MKTITQKVLVFIITMFFGMQAFADFSIVPSFSAGQKKMEFGRSFDASVTSVDFTILNLGLTAAFDAFYVNLSSDQPASTETTNGGQVEADHNSISLTVGCNCLGFAEDLTVFAGYTTANTEITGSKPGETFKEDHTDSGFFVGGTYPFFYGEKGGFTGTLAYAVLDGKVDAFDEFSSINQTFNGDTTGLSYGFTWAGSVSERMDYSVAYKIQNYFFETNVFGVDKNFTAITGGLTYFF